MRMPLVRKQETLRQDRSTPQHSELFLDASSPVKTAIHMTLPRRVLFCKPCSNHCSIVLVDNLLLVICLPDAYIRQGMGQNPETVTMFSLK